MSLTLEQEAELLPLAEKASDLIVNLIMEEGSASEFQKIVKQISVISPIVSKIYLGLYNLIPSIKSRLYKK